MILDYPVPRIMVYSLESAVAEKFEAIVKLNAITSRMKDFHDIHFIATQHAFKIGVLRKACTVTFTKRGTAIEDRDAVFSEGFKKDTKMQLQWSAFHKRSALKEKQSFGETIELVQAFLDPVFDKTRKKRMWSPEQWKWLTENE